MDAVVVLGGNGFIGFETVLQLLQLNLQLILVNRGVSWNWDKLEQLPSNVTQVICDRNEDFEKCTALKQVVDSHKSFRAVVDFSGFQKQHVYNALEMFGPKMQLYIYISTDSVYEVSQERTHEGDSLETDAVRPESMKEAVELASYDYYGHHKLECEETIEETFEQKNYQQHAKYMFLRLPDVLGPRDTTNRWWAFQLILQAAATLDVPLKFYEPFKEYKMSMVFVSDIAKLIHDLVDGRLKLERSEAFNLAFNEQITIAELAEQTYEVMFANRLLRTPMPAIEYSHNALRLYPSVSRGPIDTSKASSLLQWQPTPFKEALRRTILFYDNVSKGDKFLQEKEDIFRRASNTLHIYDEVDKFNKLTSYIELNILQLDLREL